MKPSQHLPRKAQIRTNRLKLRCPRIQKSRTSERTSQEFLRHHQFEPQCPLRVKCCCRNNAPIAENESIPLSLCRNSTLRLLRGGSGKTERERERRLPLSRRTNICPFGDRHNEMAIRERLLPVSSRWFLKCGPPISHII